ncbi:MAG: OmpA family protein [Alkalispirochaeta sp.]
MKPPLLSPKRLTAYLPVLLLLVIAPLGAQEHLLTLDLGAEVEILRRWNYSVHLDGRYQGHTNRETLLLLSRRQDASTSATETGAAPAGTAPSREISPPSAPQSDTSAVRRDLRENYSGELMVSENTTRDSRTVAQRVAERNAASVAYARSGVTVAPEGQRAPLFRSVPRFPEEPVASGSTWQAPGVAHLYLEGDVAVAVPVLVAYRYEGITDYQGERVHHVTGMYALRGPLSRGELGSHPARDLIAGLPTLPGDYVLHGSHEITVLLPAGGGAPILQRTTLREQLRHPSGSLEERTGFLLTWYRSSGDIEAQDEAIRIASSITSQIEEEGIEDVEVRATEDNRVSLSIRNLQFVADQAVLLPGERPRLDRIADALRSVPDRNILIVGHTADVGTEISQIELSFERAKRIVDEMVARGIEAGRLLYDGRGGSDVSCDRSLRATKRTNRATGGGT